MTCNMGFFEHFKQTLPWDDMKTIFNGISGQWMIFGDSNKMSILAKQ